MQYLRAVSHVITESYVVFKGFISVHMDKQRHLTRPTLRLIY